MKIKNTIKTCLLLLACFMIFPEVSAQKIKFKKGDFKELQGESEVLVEFDYSDIIIGKKKSEEEYVNEKVSEKNKKKAGSGDKWKKDWEGDRDRRFEPKFMDLMNKGLDEYGVEFSEDATDAKYKMLVKITHIEPGFNIGIVKREASVSFQIELYQGGKMSSMATVLKAAGAKAFGGDFDSTSRIEESFAKGGKAFSKKLRKKAFKGAKKKKK